MRSTFVAIVAMTVVAATHPTFAAARHHHSTPTPTFASAKQSQSTASQNQPTPSYDSCGALSVERGAAPGQGNSSNPDALNKAFMRQCLAGQIPLGR
jgi:hypothetical protein